MPAQIPSIKDDPHYFGALVTIDSPTAVPELWRNTPIEQLIVSQNFGLPIENPDQRPQLLISTCIEFRYALPIPRMYSYVMRRAGGRLHGAEFPVAYCLAHGVRHLALIGHNDCGMTKAKTLAPDLVDALVEQQWSRSAAEEFVQQEAPKYAFENELEALKGEYHRLRSIFKQLVIAPLFVSLDDCKLHVPSWFIYSLINGKEPVDSASPSDALIKSL